MIQTAIVLGALAAALAQFDAPRLAPPPVLAEIAPTDALSAPRVDSIDGSIDELRARVAAVLAREGVPGVAIALVGRDGPIWIGGVGVADLATREPVRADTVFRVASITKSIVALGVMRLVEQGRLDLDRPLREIVPDAQITNAWEAAAPVTLAQVLEHTAGLDDMRPNETFTDDDALGASAALAINPRSRVVRWRPGTRMSYSNVGYTLAARAIEVATGEPFDAWLRREVLAPLGMRDADFRRTGALAARLATGYVDRGWPARFSPIAHRPAGALLASATDLARLVQFWLRRGDGYGLVSPAGLARIERTGTLPYGPLDTNYGLGNYGDVRHAVRGRGHDGGLPGFVSSMRYFPELGLGYVVLMNATHSARAYAEVGALVFAYLVGDRAMQPRAVAAARGRPAAGYFAFASPRHELFGFLDRVLFGWRVVTDSDRVWLHGLRGGSAELVPTPDGAFRLRDESGSSIRFTRDGRGWPVMVAAAGFAEAGSWWLARLRLGALTIAVLLLQLAPLWAGGAIAVAVVRRRREVALDLIAWPGLAGGCLIAMPRLFLAAAMRDELGAKTPWTIALCATTIVFALAACAGVAAAVRWSLRPDRPPLASRVMPTAMALAALGLAVWLGAHGIIGLRTWAW